MKLVYCLVGCFLSLNTVSSFAEDVFFKKTIKLKSVGNYYAVKKLRVKNGKKIKTSSLRPTLGANITDNNLKSKVSPYLKPYAKISSLGFYAKRSSLNQYAFDGLFPFTDAQVSGLQGITGITAATATGSGHGNPIEVTSTALDGSVVAVTQALVSAIMGLINYNTTTTGIPTSGFNKLKVSQAYYGGALTFSLVS